MIFNALMLLEVDGGGNEVAKTPDLRSEDAAERMWLSSHF